MAEQKHTLLRLANQVHDAYALLPCSDEVTSDTSLKLLCDAAEKTTSAFYSYLNDRIANAPVPTSELVKIAAEMNETEVDNTGPVYTGICEKCGNEMTFTTVICNAVY